MVQQTALMAEPEPTPNADDKPQNFRLRGRLAKRVKVVAALRGVSVPELIELLIEAPINTEFNRRLDELKKN